jgi:branched-chain amino acid transport system ATP-binding protein
MLDVTDLHAYYGKSHILQGVTLSVGDNEVVSLLGRNGVGRSTTTMAIMGMVSAHGSVRLRGRELIGLPPHEVARQGIGIVPESRAIFPTLTVRENLLIGTKTAIRIW